ncbi:GbsR/MarR family transcriptional regulator [Nocardia lijiangensis]|uniref:GbsR/MarR family transcriptional regulator n=1 Tax=Nocardia lijiangensis TaxID=299618 RepID=UPI00082CE170|nr:helix-turn-helix domain-containing protein [Nocardia lijiangensis]
MPGGRLTEQDRRHIAAGLAAGLDYAEIARRVGRPTSTVTREVARNGGPGGYRADLAQRATRRRARRRIATAPQELSAATFGRDDDTVREFAEQFAALMVDSGLPRMAARVLASLFTTDSGSATAAELARRLRVSPASISKAVAYLDGLEVIRRAREGRRERYIVDDDVWFRAWSDSARTTNQWAEAAERGAEIFGATTPVGERLEHMGLFFARLARDIAGGPVDTAAGEHALTVIAALVHAGTPLTPEQLAAALEWPLDQVTSALHDAGHHPDLADPVTVRGNKSGAFSVIARTDRLTTAQRRRLTRDAS